MLLAEATRDDAITAPALFTGERAISRGELEQLVDERRAVLGERRRLVLLRGGNDLDFVVTYLAARAGRHPVILAGNDAEAGAIVDRFAPAVVVTTGNGGFEVEHGSTGGDDRQPDLHPDLAVLMSTSGTTGAPKLVRLSSSNLDSNAGAIAEFQRLTAGDRGITSLPLHYCYGLSVLNAHLSVGAPVVLTDLSVVDPCFWAAMRRHGVTNLAGVPHTFDLIDQVGSDRLALDSLRLVTQAGGRMRPEMVRRMASLGQRLGWDLLVMYGQTEATARMAYLPADLAHDHPDRVGIAVPGGSFTIRPLPDLGLADGVGAVVYRGPNVMMGYAECGADLARPAELTELDTGDLGRIDEHGLLEIVGRRNRFAKLFGLRIDLARLERQLAERGIEAICASDDERLVIGVERPQPALAELAGALTSLPVRTIRVVECERLPRLANGKPDYQALLARESATPDALSARTAGASIDAIFSDVLFSGVLFSGVRRAPPIADTDTFASLGGDSFSYVEVSIRIEELLGFVPEAWHLTPVGELRAMQPRPRVRTPALASVETNVVLRAFAIVAIVTTHMRVARIPAGAHILLAVVGFNYARFQLARLHDGRASGVVVRRALRPVARIAAVTSAWVAAQMLLFGGHGAATLLLVNNYLGAPEHVEGRWRYWFFEAVVQLMLVLAVLFSVERVRAFEHRHPFATPLLLLVPAAVLRFEIVELGDAGYNYVYRPDTVVWCFLLGWAAARAGSWRERAIVSALTLALVPDFFHYVDREVRLALAVLLLTWLPTVPVPRPLARPIGWLASASMWIFMTHWLVWPALTDLLPRELAMVATLTAGVAAWSLGRSVAATLRRLRPARRARPPSSVRVTARLRFIGRHA